jgi:hypothetical protein
MKVLAWNLADSVCFELPRFRVSTCSSSMLRMREKRLIRSKKRARLWYDPLRLMLIGHSL